MIDAVDADAEDDRRALPFNQNSGNLVAVDQEIVRPFQR
jgi:hypothetical protein